MHTIAKFQLFHFPTGVTGLSYNRILTAGNTFTEELTDMLGPKLMLPDIKVCPIHMLKWIAIIPFCFLLLHNHF